MAQSAADTRAGSDDRDGPCRLDFQAITVAAQLGVADALAHGPLPIDELAARVDADADALRRLLRALISRGIFRIVATAGMS